jgi:hypothetical protein
VRSQEAAVLEVLAEPPVATAPIQVLKAAMAAMAAPALALAPAVPVERQRQQVVEVPRTVLPGVLAGHRECASLGLGQLLLLPFGQDMAT